jgi:hypothetical protein
MINLKPPKQIRSIFARLKNTYENDQLPAYHFNLLKLSIIALAETQINTYTWISLYNVFRKSPNIYQNIYHYITNKTLYD